MDNEKYEIIKNGKGFIAALDQSGGSSSKTLKAYGIPESEYNTEEEIEYVIRELPGIVSYLRNMSPVWEDLEKGVKKHVI